MREYLNLLEVRLISSVGLMKYTISLTFNDALSKDTVSPHYSHFLHTVTTAAQGLNSNDVCVTEL